MDALTLTLAALVLAVLLAGLHEWLVDSELLELGTVSWSPLGAEQSLRSALSHGLVAAIVPLLGWAVATALVLTTPFRVWIWGVVVVLGLTVTLSPVLAFYRYETRPLTTDERAVLRDLPELGCDVVVVRGTPDGPVNGYAIGGPFRDVVGVSEFALDLLDPEELAALLAHEACHHEERHVLVRGGASLLVLAAGSLALTGIFDTLVPAATIGLVGLVVGERLFAFRVVRALEFRADAVAVRHTSVTAVRSLLETLDLADPVDQAAVPRWLGAFSTHPSYPARLARLESARGADGSGSRPAPKR